VIERRVQTSDLANSISSAALAGNTSAPMARAVPRSLSGAASRRGRTVLRARQRVLEGISDASDDDPTISLIAYTWSLIAAPSWM